ncbi:MAG: hypothetical protein V3T14_08290, partial [Myxococcota bacterium]
MRRKAYDAGLTKGKLRASREEEREAATRSRTRTGVSPRGKELYGKAIQSERAGDLKNAIASMKLATTFEPKNQFFKAKLEELENLAREEKKKARS